MNQWENKNYLHARDLGCRLCLPLKQCVCSVHPVFLWQGKGGESPPQPQQVVKHPFDVGIIDMWMRFLNQVWRGRRWSWWCSRVISPLCLKYYLLRNIACLLLCSSLASPWHSLALMNGQKLPLLWGEQHCTGEQPGLAVGLCLGQLSPDTSRGKDSGWWGGGKQQQYCPGHEGIGEHPAPAAPLLGTEASKVGLWRGGLAGASMCFQRHLEKLLRPRSLKLV